MICCVSCVHSLHGPTAFCLLCKCEHIRLVAALLHLRVARRHTRYAESLDSRAPLCTCNMSFQQGLSRSTEVAYIAADLELHAI